MPIDSAAVEELVNSSLKSLSLDAIIRAVLVAALCLIVTKLLLTIATRHVARTKLDPTLKKLVRIALKILLLFISAVIVLSYLNIPVTSLVAVLSVVGLAFSLAVQNFLSNVAGGLQLIASKPFSVGDFVEVGGCTGTIAEVGLFYTKLNSGDNKLIQIPNSIIVAENIINHSSEETRRVEIKVTASYEAPIEQVRETLYRLAGEHPLTSTTPEPMVHVNAYLDSSIEYILRTWCANGDYWTVYFELMDAVKPAFDAAGIEMTYPHVNVHMEK